MPGAAVQDSGSARREKVRELFRDALGGDTFGDVVVLAEAHVLERSREHGRDVLGNRRAQLRLVDLDPLRFPAHSGERKTEEVVRAWELDVAGEHGGDLTATPVARRAVSEVRVISSLLSLTGLVGNAALCLVALGEALECCVLLRADPLRTGVEQEGAAEAVGLGDAEY